MIDEPSLFASLDIWECHLQRLNHLPDEHQPFIEQKLIAAWNMAGYAEARRALDRIHEELEAINPSAARSLAEGLEETLTIHRLRVPAKLRLTLFSTNPIESALSVVEEKCGRVKKWTFHEEQPAGNPPQFHVVSFGGSRDTGRFRS